MNNWDEIRNLAEVELEKMPEIENLEQLLGLERCYRLTDFLRALESVSKNASDLRAALRAYAKREHGIGVIGQSLGSTGPWYINGRLFRDFFKKSPRLQCDQVPEDADFLTFLKEKTGLFPFHDVMSLYGSPDKPGGRLWVYNQWRYQGKPTSWGIVEDPFFSRPKLFVKLPEFADTYLKLRVSGNG